MNLVITDTAKKRINDYQTAGGQFLRIAVVSGGCSGMTYNAVLEDTITDQDEIIFQDGDIKIIADQKSTLFLEGLHIDYSYDLIQAGFRITNPNASASCACGSSFAV